MVTVDPADVSTDPNKAYFDKETLKKLKYGSIEWEGRVQQQIAEKKKSCTLYVGNLSFQTTEEQIFELFSVSGEVKQVIMGLDKINYTPCGFCFVEFHRREDAESCMRFINGTKLDERVIRTDWDAGFIEGRQFGRGRSGGQVRDEYRSDFDPDRGGFGHNIEPFHMKVFKEMMSATSQLGPTPTPTPPVPPVAESAETETATETETGKETGVDIETGKETGADIGTGEVEMEKVTETEVPVIEENVDTKEENVDTKEKNGDTKKENFDTKEENVDTKEEKMETD